MKTKFKSQAGNRRYSIGEKYTPVGNAKHVVWSNEIVGIIDNVPHMIGVKLHGGDVIWCRDNDEGVRQLIKDRRNNGGR